MKLDQLRESLWTTFKLISFIGFIVTGALTVALVYERLYKKFLNYDKEKIDKNKWYFYIIAALIEGVFIYLYILLFQGK
jgi:TRAP-type mannitol/chloroaromatic compound transport system permease large subunit